MLSTRIRQGLIAFWTIVCGFMAIPLLLLGFRRAGFYVAKQLWSPALRKIVGAQVTVLGREHIDQSQPYIYILNHQSNYDIPLALEFIEQPFVFIMKEELRKVFIIGRSCEAYNMVFIDRSDKERAKASIKEAQARVRDGQSVLIYPEGGRKSGEYVHPFKKGAALSGGQQQRVAIARSLCMERIKFGEVDVRPLSLAMYI